MQQPEKKYIVFGSPLIEQEEIDEVVATLKSGWIGTGPKVAQFEKLVSEYVNARHGLALNSCTAGIHLALLVCGVGPGDEVITTPFTFTSTVNAIVHAGAKPVFVDINPDTMNIDECLIEKTITDKTKAILPVHFAGRPCNMDAIMEIARRHNLYVIEDAAHALGAEYKGKKIGSIGDLTCFSFYVTKNIVTGEGGMVTTDRQDFADRIKIYSLHGMTKDAWKRYSDDGYRHYQVVYPGFKYNMMDLQAALGVHQIKKIERFDRRRQEIWDAYNRAFQGLPLTLPAAPEPGTRHAKHLYTVLVDRDICGLDRDEFMARLHQEGIGTGVHFLPVHLHPYYRERWNFQPGDFPHSEKVGQCTVSLPLSAKLTDEEVDRIIRTVIKIFDTVRSASRAETTATTVIH